MRYRGTSSIALPLPMRYRSTSSVALLLLLVLCCCHVPTIWAYVEAPLSFGAVIQQSSHICVMTVTKVDREKNLIIYQKVADLKGKHPQETIKHNIGKNGLRPGEWESIMAWAEVGKTAVFFHNGSASETFIGMNWYQAYPGGDWWNMTHAEPFLLRSFAGKPEKLIAAVQDILAGKEVVVPCMVDGNKEDLHTKKAKIQRLRASLKLQDYNPKRDFVGWGGEDIRRLSGMPGFSHYGALPRVDADANAISCIDFDGDGRLDLCLCGAEKVVLLQNQGDSFNEITLPGLSIGSRGAVWADYNGDGKPDLLLATVVGPKLYTNLGGGGFRDDTLLLPQETGYHPQAIAWIDANSDGKPDILFCNGYHGMRLYLNDRPADAAVKLTAPRLGDWYFTGPFDNTNGKGFETVYEPEKGVQLQATYKGKKNQDLTWKKGPFADGSVNNLLPLFPADLQNDGVIYLYRTIEVSTPTELPASFGSDDTLTVWLNGEKLIADPSYRAAAPDQNRATLRLKPGKNELLLKVCQGTGDWEFYFAAGIPKAVIEPWFKDVTDLWGLGKGSAIGSHRGDSLTVADFDGDGRADFLFGAAQGMLFRNTGKRFDFVSDSGIRYQPGKVGPAIADFDGDGLPDLFIPQNGVGKLFRNQGNCKFVDVTAAQGDLALPIPGAVAAAWGDFNNDGKPDLLIGCLRGVNRYYENAGDKGFIDRSVDLGLTQRLYNSQAVAFADVNGDGKLDMIFNNEGQESCLLLADPDIPTSRTPVSIHLPTRSSAIGGQVTILDANGKRSWVEPLTGGDGRGGQRFQSRVALKPGTYQIQFQDSTGKLANQRIDVGEAPVRIRLE